MSKYDNVLKGYFILSGLVIAALGINLLIPSHADENPDLKCLVFNNASIAMIKVGSLINYAGDRFNYCDGFDDTMVWFKEHGYHIVSSTPFEVYMERP